MNGAYADNIDNNLDKSAALDCRAGRRSLRSHPGGKCDEIFYRVALAPGGTSESNALWQALLITAASVEAFQRDFCIVMMTIGESPVVRL